MRKLLGIHFLALVNVEGHAAFLPKFLLDQDVLQAVYLFHGHLLIF